MHFVLVDLDCPTGKPYIDPQVDFSRLPVALVDESSRGKFRGVAEPGGADQAKRMLLEPWPGNKKSQAQGAWLD